MPNASEFIPSSRQEIKIDGRQAASKPVALNASPRSVCCSGSYYPQRIVRFFAAICQKLYSDPCNSQTVLTVPEQ